MHKQSFTLVELLTVIAIIAILAGLLFPAVNASRNSARAAECLSNQKQVMTAVIQSMNNNKGFFYSPNYAGKNEAESDTVPVRWTARLKNRGYLTDYAVMRCPVIGMPDSGTRDGFKDDAFTYGAVYTTEDDATAKGFDFRGTKFLRDGSKADVSPSKLLIGGCTLNAKGVGGALLDPSQNSAANVPYGAFLQAHQEKVNLFFLDGRAAAVQIQELPGLFYPSYTDGCAANSFKTSGFPVL